MIDIPRMARESGGSYDEMMRHGERLQLWIFSPDELQLFAEKVMQTAQAAEMERARGLVPEKGDAQ